LLHDLDRAHDSRLLLKRAPDAGRRQAVGQPANAAMSDWVPVKRDWSAVLRRNEEQRVPKRAMRHMLSSLETSVKAVAYPSSAGQPVSCENDGAVAKEVLACSPSMSSPTRHIVLDPYISALASSANAVTSVRKPFGDLVSRLHKQFTADGIKLIADWNTTPSSHIEVPFTKCRQHSISDSDDSDEDAALADTAAAAEEEVAGSGSEDSASVDENCEERAYLLSQQFWRHGRVSNLDHVLAMHPQYFGVYAEVMSAAMQNEGQLPLPTRYYIAIMASSSYRCEYLIRDLSNKFLDAGGDMAWLHDFGAFPRLQMPSLTCNRTQI